MTATAFQHDSNEDEVEDDSALLGGIDLEEEYVDEISMSLRKTNHKKTSSGCGTRDRRLGCLMLSQLKTISREVPWIGFIAGC